MYGLIFANQTSLLSHTNEENVQSVQSIRSRTNDIIACVRKGRDLIGYKFQKSTETWQQYWRETVFNNREGNYPLDRYPWLVANKLLPNADVVVLKHPDGIRFYQVDPAKSRLKLLKEDDNFHDVYGYNLLLGNFYPDEGYIGALSRGLKQEIQFYAASEDSFRPDTTDPLFPLQNELSLSPAWRSSNTDFFVAKILHGNQEAIGLRTAEGLEIYQFTDDYSFENIVNTKQIPKSQKKDLDRIYFADITHGKYRDILHVNKSGLFVYQYINRDYKCLNHNSEFTRSYGWLQDYSDSITLLDINGDKFDDLIYTGPRGITALSFDKATNTWETLLNSDHLPGAQRFANVVGSISAIPPVMSQPSIFTQDAVGKLQWAKIVRTPHITINEKTTTTTPSPPRISGQIYEEEDHVVPDQMSRKILPESPVLRWSEQFTDKFLKEAVDTGSGQVHLNIPLIDISSVTTWALQFTLSYDSRNIASDLLGVGWSLPLGQDFIFADYQGTIYSENIRYYLTVQGAPQLLKTIETKNGIQRFQLDGDEKNEKIRTIEYDVAKQQWTVGGEAEKNIYGKADRGLARDALVLSLVGPGRDETQLFTTAWYLNTRLNDRKTLYYYYEIDSTNGPGGKSYTSAIRLKTISDNYALRLTFDYSVKNESEYTTPSPVDDQGMIIFPLPHVRNRYLQGFNLTTSAYSQNLKFVYEMDNGTRFLSGITQQILSLNELIMKFSYARLSDKPVLKSCKFVPRGSIVNLSYESINVPMPANVPNKLISYLVGEDCQFSVGPDYTIIAYKTAHEIALQIMNREITEIDIWTVINTNTEIYYYSVQVMQNSFVVFVETDGKRAIYIFNRDRKKNWPRKPTTEYSFNIKVLVKFGQAVIVVADPDKKKIMFLEHGDDPFTWTEKIITSFRPIKLLACYKSLVVAYDDHQLWIYYRNPQSGWQSKVLDPNLTGLAKMNGNTVASFDWSPKVSQQVTTALEQNGLQILDNFILLSGLETSKSKLFSHVHLLLLDLNKNISKKQSFKILRDNLDEIDHELKSKDGGIIQHLGYVNEGGKFEVRVTNITGKIIDDIRNKNIRYDAVDQQKNDINNDPEFIKKSKEFLILDWNRYKVQISPYTAYCGEDIIFRKAGSDWVQEPVPADKTIHLGQHFILDVNSNDTSLYKLYKQDTQKNKQGDPVKEFKLHSSKHQLINRYPNYIAFQPQPNSVSVLTFHDEKTLGQVHTFNGERPLMSSDWQYFITVTELGEEKYDCKIRPITLLVPPKPRLFVNQVMLTDGYINRSIGYQRTFTNDLKNDTFSEKVSIIPGDDKTVYGWREAVRSLHFKTGNITYSDHWFNANGEEVFMPPKKRTEEDDSYNTTETSSNKRVLLDRSGKWSISDFSPFQIADEMIAYYGFESYENDLLTHEDYDTNRRKIWRISNAKVIRGGFAFTGESFLQLGESSFFEGIFKPRDQETTYLAACWIRCTTSLALNTPVPYLRTVISTTNGDEVIGLLGQVKHQIGDWYYIEQQVDFQMIKQIYRDYIDYFEAYNSSTPVLPLANRVQFQITIRVEVPSDQIVDLDHIRFSPVTHDFQAMVYNSRTGTCTAIIQANGLVIRNLYNRLEQEIADINEEGQLTQFFSSSKTGKLFPTPQGIIVNAHSNVLYFDPTSGFYENFDPHALRTRWQIYEQNAWHIAPGQLWHTQLEKHQIVPSKNIFDSSSAAIRLYFALQKSQSSLSFHWNKIVTIEFIRQADSFTKLILFKNHIINPLPSAGELIIMVEGNYVWLWFDGVLLLDRELPMPQTSKTNQFIPWSSFEMYVKGQVVIEDFLVMNRPQVRVEYYNTFGEKTQVIQLEDTKTCLVTETLYDEIGRDAITTKTTRIHREAGQGILQYHPEFVVNKNYSDLKSVWHTGSLKGEIDRFNPLDGGVAYIRTKYAPNPLNQAAILGLPGPAFSVTGPYATKMSQNSDIAFLYNIFPPSHGYLQSVEHTPSGTLKVTIFDKNGNQVALYVRVPSFNHLLSTYEYDENNRLIKIIPPLYHEKVNTTSKTTPWQSGEDHLSIQEKQWQRILATSFVYDKNGRLIRKKTTDSGVTEYIYNNANQLRFTITLNSTEHPQQIAYFNYDSNDQLTSTGYFNSPLPVQHLQKLTEIQTLPNTSRFQSFSYADDHVNPLLRNRVKSSVTYNEGEPVIDKLQFNDQQDIVAKSTITLTGQADGDEITEFKRQYINNKIHVLTYPVDVNGKPLTIVHKYNKLGQLIALGTSDHPNKYATFNYHASGQLATEQYQPNHEYGFTRNYRYNSPGFLDQIKDPFLMEELTYTEKGYGKTEYSGLIMQTAFNAKWPEDADGRWFQLHNHDLDSKYSQKCLKVLRNLGYLTAHYKPIKLFIRDTETTLPLVCGGKTGGIIAKLVAEKQVPKLYGHRYAYGNHQELVKAKYFTEDSKLLIEPLQLYSFAKEISNLTNSDSKNIWQSLIKAGYINTDQQRSDPASAIGKRGKSVVRSTDLYNDLLSVNRSYILYIKPIEQLIISTITKQGRMTMADFETVFLQWQGIDSTSSILVKNQEKLTAKRIGQMLFSKGYLPTKKSDFSGALDKNFVSVLRKYNNFIPQIVRVLSNYFAHSLGETPFDVESYNIDANGNHRLFYTGYNRFEFTYVNATNKIQTIKLKSPTVSGVDQTFPMSHDDQGNVIEALHKGIKSIKYHPVSQRTTSIELADGRILRFYYDAQGERVLKRVFDADGKITQETHYLRDEQGRVLVDRQTKYLPETTQTIITAYLYGPRGLLGFFRNNNFYSVTTDHAGSVRLIMENGRVVAAYDYLPYGELMRTYGSDPRVQIVYRYTGQEWDEETGLYNYHARLYDPSIGRFYQPDPKAQYFSPYKYAGNSPISTIDPDGEFAFVLLCLAFAFVGAYLGGAAANHRWNPADWDYHDLGTYFGMGSGFIAGGLLPVGFSASVASIGLGGTTALGIGGAYLQAAAANGNWDPSKWQWDRPQTFNGLFVGFAAGSGLAGGIKLAHSFANSGKALTSLANALKVSREVTKVVFLSVSYTAAGGLTYGAGVLSNNGDFAFWRWDWSNPATWSALLDGFDTGMGWPQNFIEIGRGIRKVGKSFFKPAGQIGKPSKLCRLKTILKNPKHPLYKTTTSVVMAYFMGSAANSDFDITRWSLASFSTYEGILNGVFFGKDTSNLLQFARRSRTNQKFNLRDLTSTFKHIVKHWTERYSHMLDKIQEFRKKVEYHHSMKQLFSSDKIWHEKFHQILRDERVRKEAERFFKGGFEKWQKGEIEPPETIKSHLSQEVERKLHQSAQTQKLIEWRKEEQGFLKQRTEIYPDRDVEFLNCHSLSRRSKRVAGGSVSCVPSSSSSAAASKEKTEISEKFLDINDPGIQHGILESDGFKRIEPDSKTPDGFAEHFSVILRNTPTTHAASKPNFFVNFMLGSLYTAPSNLSSARKRIYVKTEKIEIGLPNKSGFHETTILKTAYKHEDNTIILKTFIFEEHAIKADTAEKRKYYKENLVSQSKYSKVELENLSRELGISTNDHNIQETIFYTTPDHSLSLKESSIDNYQFKSNSGSQTQKFHEIDPVRIADKDLEKLSSNDPGQVKRGMETISQKLMNAYHPLKGGFGTSEAAFHGFVYGALSLNFKYRYHLNIYVERIAGRGYADLLLLSRKDGDRNKNWEATPIIMEFKADKTEASSAVDQILDTGYLYNLSLRTVADKAVIVGINSNIAPTDVSRALDVRIENIPRLKSVVDELINNTDGGAKIPNDVRLNRIKEEIKHLYYSTSPLSIKTQNRYLSRLILGEFLSANNVEVYVRQAAAQITSFVFKTKDSKNWVMLNIMESGKPKQKSSEQFNKLPNDVSIESLTKIDINVGHAGKEERSFSNFFKNIEISEISKKSDITGYGTISYSKLDHIDVDNFFIKGNIEHELDTLSKSIKLVAKMIDSEGDFQAILHGIFVNNANNKSPNTIKVLPEANFSKAGRLDLLVSKFEQIRQNDQILMMELKYDVTGHARRKLDEANEQILKYVNNKSVTDAKTITPIAIVFNKAAKGNEEVVIYQIHSEDTISHTSGSDPSYYDEDFDGIDVNSIPGPSSEDLYSQAKRLDYNLNNPPNKRLKIEPRERRSLNYTKECETRSIKNEIADRRDDIDDVVSSGASSRSQFWPFNLIGGLGVLISSNLPVNWLSDVCKREQLPISQPSLTIDHQKPLKYGKAAPTLLEMGDRWHRECDTNGLLSLGILLVRKLTGYKPNTPDMEPDDRMERNIQLDIQSADILNTFITVVLEQAEFYGIGSHMSDILDDSEIYYNTLKSVRENFARGEVGDIPQLLYQRLVRNNTRRLEFKSTQKQVEQLLAGLSDYLLVLRKELLADEQNWQFNAASNHARENIYRGNVDILNNTVSSSQNFAKRCIATMNKTELFTTIGAP